MHRPITIAGVAAAMLAFGPAGAAAQSAPPAIVAEATCSSSALLQPLLSPPSCTTDWLGCPLPAGSTCLLSGRANATAAVGGAGARLLLEVRGVIPGFTARAESRCGVEPGTCTAFGAGTLALSQSAGEARARCIWDSGATLAVQARLACAVQLIGFTGSQ